MLVGKMTGCCISMPIRARRSSGLTPGPRIDWPCRRTSPVTVMPGVSSIRRFRHLRSVLLPAPDAPIRPNAWRGATSRLTLRRIVRLPATTVRSRTCRIGGAAGRVTWTGPAAGFAAAAASGMAGLLVGAKAHRQRNRAQQEADREQDGGGAPDL